MIVTDLITHQLSSSSNSGSNTGSSICVGVQTLNRLTNRMEEPVYTNVGVVLASGGLGGIYEHSTNPAGYNALGSSVALALRSGAATKDLEYVEFHPKSLFVPNESRFLLSEALRGKGAKIKNGSGHEFTYDSHRDFPLAPRDVVVRAVFLETLKKTKIKNGLGAQRIS